MLHSAPHDFSAAADHAIPGTCETTTSAASHGGGTRTPRSLGSQSKDDETTGRLQTPPERKRTRSEREETKHRKEAMRGEREVEEDPE